MRGAGGTVYSHAFKNEKLVLWNETWNYDLTGRVQQYESPRLILISSGVFYHWNCSQAAFCRELQAEAGDWRAAPGTPIRCWLTHCWLVDFPGARSLFEMAGLRSGRRSCWAGPLGVFWNLTWSSSVRFLLTDDVSLFHLLRLRNFNDHMEGTIKSTQEWDLIQY